MANRCSCRQLSVISSFAVASFVSASRYGGPGRCQSARLPAARDANRGKVDTAGRHVRQIKLSRRTAKSSSNVGALVRLSLRPTRREVRRTSIGRKKNGPAHQTPARSRPKGRGLSNPASKIKPLTGAAALAPHSAPHRPRRRRHDLTADYRIRDVEAYRVVIVVFNYERKRVAARQAEVR